MNEQLLVSASELAELIATGDSVVFDCRFDLLHRSQGRNSWLAAHIPGAVYAHLDDHLAGKVTEQSGRHPLPNTRSFASFLARSGWSAGRRIIAYDAQGGAYAARLWWLMRYYGHDCVSLLNGGIRAWREARLPLENGQVNPPRQPLSTLRAQPGMILDAAAVGQGLAMGDIVLVDARDADRFNGATEPIDAVAGHVPGARNRPFTSNLGQDQKFIAASSLRAAFNTLMPEGDPSTFVHMCGSGVTACHNLLAMELAGLGGSRLYGGSWSEWIRDPARPVAAET